MTSPSSCPPLRADRRKVTAPYLRGKPHAGGFGRKRNRSLEPGIGSPGREGGLWVGVERVRIEGGRPSGLSHAYAADPSGSSISSPVTRLGRRTSCRRPSCRSPRCGRGREPGEGRTRGAARSKPSARPLRRVDGASPRTCRFTLGTAPLRRDELRRAFSGAQAARSGGRGRTESSVQSMTYNAAEMPQLA